VLTICFISTPAKVRRVRLHPATTPPYSYFPLEGGDDGSIGSTTRFFTGRYQKRGESMNGTQNTHWSLRALQSRSTLATRASNPPFFRFCYLQSGSLSFFPSSRFLV